jgi:hypothetical protein
MNYGHVRPAQRDQERRDLGVFCMRELRLRL